jgi:hypothetical protein
MLALSPRAILFRNQSGQYQAEGRWIRYGIANPGGSDLIGWTTVEVTPEMVGRKVAIFSAIEVKTPTGRPTLEQTRFIEAVRRAGGIACIARSEAEAEKTVAEFSTEAHD